jgi:mannose-6-phosphate isomerase-like protein (cupin superfamily)
MRAGYRHWLQISASGGDGCFGWHLLKTDTLSVIQEKIPPVTSEQLHFHTHAQQVFYILSGVAVFEIDGQVIVINAKESNHIPKMIKHCISTKGDQDLEFLVISEPKSDGDRQNL